jgi:hypothetical protein
MCRFSSAVCLLTLVEGTQQHLIAAAGVEGLNSLIGQGGLLY